MVNLECPYLFVSKSKHDFHFHTKLVAQVANAGCIFCGKDFVKACQLPRLSWSGVRPMFDKEEICLCGVG